MLAYQLMRHGVRWVVVGVGGRLAKSLNPPPPPGMIDDDDDDKMGSLLAFGLAPCKKICVKQHWDDVSHARVSPASLLVVGDCKSTAYRSAMGKPPLLPMAAGRDCVQIDRPPDSALWVAGQVAQRSDRSWRGT